VDMIGKLAASDAQRDAIHVAIAPVVAAEPLEPGTHVGFWEDGSGLVGCCKNPIGIVDPFLNYFVKPNERFYLFLYPNTVIGMRHQWSHPAFAPEVPVGETSQVAKARQWLHEFAARVGRDYDALLEIGKESIECGGACVGDDTDQDSFTADKRAFLWNVATVLGVCPPDPSDVYFRCAC
jgi:hypothetical protein